MTIIRAVIAVALNSSCSIEVLNLLPSNTSTSECVLVQGIGSTSGLSTRFKHDLVTVSCPSVTTQTSGYSHIRMSKAWDIGIVEII